MEDMERAVEAEGVGEGAEAESVDSQLEVAEAMAGNAAMLLPAAGAIGACAESLAGAAKTLEAVLEKVSAQYEALNAKVDRIIAMVEGEAETGHVPAVLPVVGAVAQHAARRTVGAPYLRLLAKNGLEDVESGVEAEALGKALGGLSVEQRIAVKSELVRAGLVR